MSSEEFDENKELCDEFIAESREMLAEVEPLLVELEAGSTESGELDISQIDSIFRAFHSMKGSGGFLNFDNLVSVTHTAESLLDLFRKGQAELVPDHITVLCRAMDFINQLLDHIESEYRDDGFEEPARAIVEQIRATMPGREAAAAPAESGANEPDAKEPCAAPETPPSADSEAGAADIAPEMLEAFVAEACERMDAAEQALVALERESERAPLLESAFRELHSLKGNCGFFGYRDMEELAHSAEDALDELRSRSSPPDAKVVSALLHAIDVLRSTAQSLPESGGRIAEDDRALTMAEAGPPAESTAAEAPPAPLETADETPEAAAPPAHAGETVEPPSAAGGEERPKSETPGRKPAKASIRVDLEKLDALMDLVGELILAETMVTHNPDLEGHHFERFGKAALHLNRITRSLQDVAMSARMIPIGGTFRKMLRLVRDLGHKQQKKIDLVLVGEETEIDKTVIEAIADPLVHIIRNSVDHGVEMPEVRRAAGKPETGTIRLEARHQGGEIWIVIQDDGSGLDREKILAKAVDRGLLDPGRSDLRDSEIFRCIFEPGFSTAAAVTDISGRGVGMDVVRRNIDALNGRVDVASTLGAGTTITIRLPLTLAIIEGMLVRVGESTYTFPLLSIRESIPVESADVTTLADGQEVVHIRGRLLPLIRLDRYHAIRSARENIEEGIVIVVHDDDPFCVWVDSILGQRQTVIKGLPEYLGGVRGVSGCSILSNGDISLILDMQAIKLGSASA